jgi:hypothetical protein
MRSVLAGLEKTARDKKSSIFNNKKRLCIPGFCLYIQKVTIFAKELHI